MVEQRGLIAPEIAETYNRSRHTVTKEWTRHPAFPAPLPQRRGRYHEYDSEAVAVFVREHVARQAVALEPDRLYTARQLEEAGVGIKAATIRADLSRSRGGGPRRWPEPDDTGHGVNRWYGRTVARALETRQGYRRKKDQSGPAGQSPRREPGVRAC
ncbi:hypothetical protein ACGRHY_29255 [Streptomyces sp. HK10]|uniref:hypothetical protein n=1 Tax=Streptomyces sp. HK10 TaxID=3373255 RepID=UPI003748AA12